MSKAVAVTSEYRSLPLTQLQESPTNPRRRFNERAMEAMFSHAYGICHVKDGEVDEEGICVG